MQFFVTKTGLGVFDAARAWGLAAALSAVTGNEVEICDADWAFVVMLSASVPQQPDFDSEGWVILFTSGNWRSVFITQKGHDSLIQKVKNQLQKSWRQLLTDLQQPQWDILGRGETIPGGLDPTAFKGVRHPTKASFGEGQLRADPLHWALACLGMATCGVYHSLRDNKRVALLLAPQKAHFRDVQNLLRPDNDNLPHHDSAQTAAAHYAVLVAEKLRERAAAQGSLQDLFSAVLYFTLFSTGQQIKPSQGSQLQIAPLLEAIAADPDETEKLLTWLDACFRLGARKGATEVALAATELVMRWDLDAFERLTRTLLRIIGRSELREKARRELSQVLDRTGDRSLRKAMEVMNRVVPLGSVQQ